MQIEKAEQNIRVVKGTRQIDRLLLTVEEVAESLGVCRSTVYDLLYYQRLPCIHLGKAVRVAADDLRAWVAGLDREVNGDIQVERPVHIAQARMRKRG